MTLARAARGRVRLRTLVLVRWVAVAGQATALLTVHVGLGYALPIWWALGAVAASAALNLWASLGRKPAMLGDRAAAAFLGYDLLQLAVLLYLTGGLGNPFAALILAPVTVSATSLSRRSTAALSLTAVAAVGVLAAYHLPLPWRAGGLQTEPLFMLGLALALAFSTVFVAAYVFSVAEEGRRMSDALAATQMALDREHRAAALGGLAAAAAHELGSPLGTIAVVARELDRDLPPDNPWRPDVDLLLSQSERCRAILAGLAARPEAETEPVGRLPLKALVETAAAAHRRGQIALTIEADGAGGEPQAVRRPELVHGLGNLIQNATQFARAAVDIALRWDAERVSVAIVDDGPGFAPALLDRLGEPYLSGGPQGRAEDEAPMGLGIFIAQTLLERTGARLAFANRPEGGARVTVTWPRQALETEGPSP